MTDPAPPPARRLIGQTGNVGARTLAFADADGTAVAVTDEELLTAQRELTEREGTFVCPEGGACFAALKHLRESGWLQGDEDVVVLNTGAGIKYPETVPLDVPLLAKTGSIP